MCITFSPISSPIQRVCMCGLALTMIEFSFGSYSALYDAGSQNNSSQCHCVSVCVCVWTWTRGEGRKKASHTHSKFYGHGMSIRLSWKCILFHIVYILQRHCRQFVLHFALVPLFHTHTALPERRVGSWKRRESDGDTKIVREKRDISLSMRFISVFMLILLC